MPKKATTKANSTDLIAMLEPYFTKQAPFQIPDNGRRMLVQWLPWINLAVAILGVFAALALLALIGVANIATAGLVSAIAGPWLLIALLALGAQITLQFIAFPGLQAKKLSAWKLLFWADVISFVYGVFNAVGTPANMVGSLLSSVLGLVIGLYILFQIKGYYK